MPTDRLTLDSGDLTLIAKCLDRSVRTLRDIQSDAGRIGNQLDRRSWSAGRVDDHLSLTVVGLHRVILEERELSSQLYTRAELLTTLSRPIQIPLVPTPVPTPMPPGQPPSPPYQPANQGSTLVDKARQYVGSNGNAGHIGIYMGDGQMTGVHGDTVHVDSVKNNPYWAGLYTGWGMPGG